MELGYIQNMVRIRHIIELGKIQDRVGYITYLSGDKYRIQDRIEREGGGDTG